MELSLTLDDSSVPSSNALVSESDYLNESESLLSMEIIRTPARILISRRGLRSPRVDLPDQKKSRLEYPDLSCPDLSGSVPCVPHSGSIPCVFDSVIDSGSIPCVLNSSTPASDPDIQEIPDPGPDPFDLGISRRNGPDVKPDPAVLFSSTADHVVGVKSDDATVQTSDMDNFDFSDLFREEHVHVTASPAVAKCRDLGPTVALNSSRAVAFGDVSVCDGLPVVSPTISPLDEIPDTAFDVFLPSLPDCELSDSDDDILEDLDNNDGVEASGSRWGTASKEDMEIVRRGGVRKSERVETWARKAFDEWRSFRGFSTIKSIADMSEEADVHPLVELLVQYFLELKMRNGGLYNPNT